MKEIEARLELELTNGYVERYTKACLRVLEKKEKLQHLLPPVKMEEKERIQGTA